MAGSVQIFELEPSHERLLNTLSQDIVDLFFLKKNNSSAKITCLYCFLGEKLIAVCEYIQTISNRDISIFRQLASLI